MKVLDDALGEKLTYCDNITQHKLVFVTDDQKKASS